MNPPKFHPGDLVVYKQEIREVVDYAPSPERGQAAYKLLLKAFLREIDLFKMDEGIQPDTIIATESHLEKFDQRPPKFEFNDRVKLNGIPCVILFIHYKNYHYYYYVKEETIYEGFEGGWIRKENYLTKM